MNEKERKKKRIGMILLLAAAGIFLLAGRSAQWVLEEWGGLDLDEILFTITRPLNGTDPGIIRNYILYAPLPAAAVVFALGTAAYSLGKRAQSLPGRMKKAAGPALVLCCALCILFGAVMAVRLWSRLGVSEYLRNQGERSDYIEECYVDPEDVQITFPEKKRNLLYLYLESMETTYTDEQTGGIFDVNYIPQLTQIALDAEDFSGPDDGTINGATSWKYATWTMGGMFAATSGLPLKIPIEMDGVDTNYMSTQDAFFPNITALGDILEEQGYENDLLIGSDATFGGRRLYFSGHGDYAFYDYNHYAQDGSLPAGYKVFWGFEDKRLFEFAKIRLGELAEGDRPFNLTMLTVDTHYPNGYRCGLCGDQYDTQYANAIACSDAQTAEFLAWCAEQDWYEDTAIVVSGDHPTMATFCDGAPEDYTRKVYTAYINAAAEPARNEKREYSTVDHFPTTLAAMGCSIEGDRLGLGTNLFSGLETLSERDTEEYIGQELAKKSVWMDMQAQVEPVTADITYEPYDEEQRILSFTIRNVSSSKVDGFRCCMKMYGYKTATSSDYIEWISAVETEDGVWHAQWELPADQAYSGIVKLQPTIMVDGARSSVLDLHYYHISYEEGGADCEWYECDPSGKPLEDGKAGED